MKQRSLAKSHFIFFIILCLFVLAQVSWWIFYQVRAGDRLRTLQSSIWQKELTLANSWISEREDDGRSSGEFNTLFPDLAYSPDNDSAIVSSQAKLELERDASRAIRMFAFEGSFFALVLLSGLIYIYWTLRRQVEFEQNQTNFLSSISHELKTPITAMRLYTETLLTHELDEEQQKQLLHDIEQNTLRMQRLVERLLKARFYQKSEFEKPTSILDISSITHEAYTSSLEALNDLKTIQAECKIEEKLFARLDPDQWRVLILNLMENCVKFSNDTPVLLLELERVNKQVILRVTDKGC